MEGDLETLSAVCRFPLLHLYEMSHQPAKKKRQSMLKRVSLVMGLGPKHAELVEEDVFDSVPPSSAAQPGVATDFG